ncbi:MAG TPA: hypothetical protein VEK15_17455 [Vicinamibacteria bacterium]|nr:hypothetical protein [Vicinamibacteria bacterium]
MTVNLQQRWVWLVGMLAFVVVGVGGAAAAQVPDADCFSGNCGGSKGIPECPRGYGEVGLVLYANSKADAQESCETVVSCTNLGKKSVEVNCRFYTGFNPIPEGGDRTDALCHSVTPDVAPGDTTECATDSTGDPLFLAGGIFLAGDADCPTFEGKGLVCVAGGKADDVLCQAHLVCGNGSVLETTEIVRTKKSKKD